MIAFCFIYSLVKYLDFYYLRLQFTSAYLLQYMCLSYEFFIEALNRYSLIIENTKTDKIGT